MAEVERLADRVIMLEKGRIIADETPPELIKRFGRANLEEVFLAIARRGVADGEDARSTT
jgi:ABC-2 type transport system ATP-binding protein